ncbi:hypothetical protein E2C01_047215 [Portunus trituberculatus]|uniref:Uncharacterized protein n=1 Tax=Portunus trituberculatus TaxID=210409 RepID=A0A5B7G7D4_PORTR|nr:hypothetical protein [Portunus trituberculatus]
MMGSTYNSTGTLFVPRITVFQMMWSTVSNQPQQPLVFLEKYIFRNTTCSVTECPRETFQETINMDNSHTARKSAGNVSPKSKKIYAASES